MISFAKEIFPNKKNIAKTIENFFIFTFLLKFEKNN
jgi:hypothetical protein